MIQLERLEKRPIVPMNYLDGTSKLLVLIDPGHGIDTRGKKSTVWNNGLQLKEWHYNRVNAYWLSRELYNNGINYILVVPEQNDVSLQERCRRINDYHKKYQNKYKPITLSLHGNAAGVGSASGIEAFTSVGYTMADPIAETLLTRLEKMNWNMRYGWGDPDGVSDKDKEMHFFILKHTMTPTILLELGFYTNYKECMKMLKASTQKKCARLLTNGLNEVEKTAVEIGI